MPFYNRHRRDDNSQEIIDALRSGGALVLDLSQVGSGCPDALVSFRGRMLLLEIKDGSKFKSQQKLTLAERTFHALWEDHVRTVSSVEEAMIMVGMKPKIK